MSDRNIPNDPNSPNPAQLVERWQNVERVLIKLPPHERRKHFNMSEFIEDTACGTVCCAAGFCAFDPWFRKRGWKAVRSRDFGDWWVPGGDINRFFGEAGSENIFHNFTPRSVRTVIMEVRAHIKVLRKQVTGYGFAAFRARALLTALRVSEDSK